MFSEGHVQSHHLSAHTHTHTRHCTECFHAFSPAAGQQTADQRTWRINRWMKLVLPVSMALRWAAVYTWHHFSFTGSSQWAHRDISSCNHITSTLTVTSEPDFTLEWIRFKQSMLKVWITGVRSLVSIRYMEKLPLRPGGRNYSFLSCLSLKPGNVRLTKSDEPERSQLKPSRSTLINFE